MDYFTKNQDIAGFPQNDRYGEYGGSYISKDMATVMQEVASAYEDCRNDPTFREEYTKLLKEYVGRPSSLFEAKNLSSMTGGAALFLKREDLNHTGAHKINNCIEQALLARQMGKKTTQIGRASCRERV